jgi:hypothetical protein
MDLHPIAEEAQKYGLRYLSRGISVQKTIIIFIDSPP